MITLVILSVTTIPYLPNTCWYESFYLEPLSVLLRHPYAINALGRFLSISRINQLSFGIAAIDLPNIRRAHSGLKITMPLNRLPGQPQCNNVESVDV